MKVIKKISTDANLNSFSGNLDGSVLIRPIRIKLRGITEADRERLRIPSYQYILP